MADDVTSSNDLLDRLTQDRLPVAHRAAELPATRSDEPSEPSLPSEHSRELGEQGRTPEEVIADREIQTRQAEPQPDKTPAKRTIKVNGKDVALTDEQIRNALTTAAQFPTIQQKYQELLERSTQLPAKETPAAAPPARITQDQIRQTYLPMLKERIEQGYMEADFGDAYINVATGMMYYADVIEGMAEKLNWAISWIDAEREMRNAREVDKRLQTALDTVAEKPAKLYHGLRNKETRGEFVEWLRKEVDPKVSMISPEYIDKQWVAFNAASVLEFVEAQRETEDTTRRRASGDGVRAAQGVPTSPQPKTLLERMTEIRLPAGN
jgi:hypothetical protein